MERALIYLRVSTLDQARKELPIESQRSRCLEFAKSKELRVDEVNDVYVDRGISGRSLGSRVGLQELLKRCKQDKSVTAVIFYDISRLARNLLDYQLLRQQLQNNGVSVLSATEAISGDDTPSGWMIENMVAMFAEFRSRQDGEKIKNSMRSKAENGIYPGYARYGYKNVQEQMSSAKSKRWMEPDEKQAPWVQKCHSLFATGLYTLDELASKLEADGMEPPKRGKLHASLIHQILRDDLYIGVIRWGGVVNYEGKHKHLISKDLFRKNQSLLDARNAGACRKRKYFYILRSAGAVCGECGAKLSAGFHTGKSKRYERYSCSKKIAGKRITCSQSVVPVKEVEKSFENVFKRIQLSDSFAIKLKKRIKEVLDRDNETDKKLYNSLSEKLTNNRESQKRLLEKYAEGKIDEDMYEVAINKYKETEIQLKDEVQRLDNRLNQVQEVLEIAIGLTNNCFKAYKKAPNDEIRALLAKTFFKKIEVREGVVSKVELNGPFYFLVRDKVRKVQEFSEAYTGGDGGS